MSNYYLHDTYESLFNKNKENVKKHRELQDQIIILDNAIRFITELKSTTTNYQEIKFLEDKEAHLRTRREVRVQSLLETQLNEILEHNNLGELND